jgi:hypothetical protein
MNENESKREQVVVFEDEVKFFKMVLAYVPRDVYEILKFTTYTAAIEFLANLTAEAASTVAAFIVDGNLSLNQIESAEGIELIRMITENPLLASALILSNSGRGKLDGADLHLEKKFVTIKEILQQLPTHVANKRASLAQN